ncbi:MAG: DUF1351 domain-containing protein [Ruminococcus sp.]|uniref:DUF1351 domain-containing protein n=1 Tax=Ruminococcus sp. TaxID=41978 RepID=UPI002873AFEF|nr:DUF1351 domain-containing protein [Ruminococcus sp.]MBQ3285433.1 DUF1351 domain-containing protein [Ruminococcus sp.]
MANEIIKVEQLPVITQQLAAIKAEIEEKVAFATALVCTEENLQEVKKLKEDMNKQFNELETQRKAVKNSILAPYNEFEAMYKECVTIPFKTATQALKDKTDAIDSEVKKQKLEKVKEHYDEKLAASGIVEDYGEFFTIYTIGLNITKAVSVKKLNEQVDRFIDRIADDLALIAEQEHADEVIYEYKRKGGSGYLNASNAIRSVNAKYKAIENEKARTAEREARAAASAAAVAKVDAAIENTPVAPPEEEKEIPVAPPEDPIITVAFKVTDTVPRLKKLKEYMEREGYKYV